jgi:predicted DNA-binding transcriptional regulator YafY
MNNKEPVTEEPSLCYTDFSFDIRPTADFLDELLKHGDGIEILEPLALREKMRQMLLAVLNRYE